MSDRKFIDGNEAIGWGAIYAGCKLYAGYPITPQNEIPEFMSRELHKAGGVFLQSEDELAAINMVFGAAQVGERAMTSTSSPGISLMQETISNMSCGEIPAVVVDVVRLGPGQGTIQAGQTDYRQATKGGGHGGYHCIVLAPSSPQDCFDFVQLGFYLADKYGMVVLVLSDFIVGRMAEPVEMRRLEFSALPRKEWALVGSGQRGGKCSNVMARIALRPHMEVYGETIPGFHVRLNEKYQEITDLEVRYRLYDSEDAEFLLIAYGSTARMVRRAVEMARLQGIKAGLLQPITLWPFPEKAVKEIAKRARKVLVVEDSQGQLVEDVNYAVLGQVPVHLLGIWGRYDLGPSGIIHSERILEELGNLL